MADSSSKLIFQGSLSLSYNPKSSSSSNHHHPTSSSKKSKSPPSPTSTYSVLYLDGRLECYPGDPFSVGSPHEACKPTYTLDLNPFHHWSLISIPTKSSLPYPFTVSRKLPPNSPARSQTSLTHLGLDVETMGTSIPSSANEKSKDRKFLKQFMGFGSKRASNKKTPDDHLQSLSPTAHNNHSTIPNNQKSPSFISKLASPPSTLSLRSSLNNGLNLPNSITFSTSSDGSRKQWIDAFIQVFRSVSDLELSSSSHFLSPSPQESNPCSPNSLATSTSTDFDQSPLSHVTSFNPSHHISRISLAPLSSQSTLLPSKLTTSESHSQPLHRSISQTASPTDLYTLKTRASAILPSISSHILTVTPAGSPNKKQHPSDTPSLTEHMPASSSPSDYCISPPISSSTSPAINGQVQIAEVVPAWIKAVRNADDKKLEQDGDFSQSAIRASPDISLSSKPQSAFDVISRDNSIDSHLVPHQGLSSSMMSQSLSAPVSASLDPPNQGSQEISKPLPPTSIKSFGNSVVQNLKRAGSLTDWPDFSNAGQSILQRMRENDNQSILSDSIMSSSSPVITHEPVVDSGDSNSAKHKRTWLLQMVKKPVHAEKPKASLNLNSSAGLLASTSGTRPPSRTARHGVYMLKGLSSNSSLASSSHHIVASSRESDGHHSLHRSHTPAGTNSDQGHYPPHSEQTFPQLPNKLSHSTAQRFPTSQSKQAFSEWLTTTTSQAASRLEHSPTAEFGPTHSKSRSLASMPWANRHSPSSGPTHGLNLPKSNLKLNHSRELGLNIMSSERVVSRSVHQRRPSSETSFWFSSREDTNPLDTCFTSTPTSERSHSPPSQSPVNLIDVQVAKEFDHPTILSRISDSYARDNGPSSEFSRPEGASNESYSKHSFDSKRPSIANNRISSPTEKNVSNHPDGSSKENLFEFLSSEPPTSSNWLNGPKLATRSRTHTIGTLYGGSYRGYEIGNGQVAIPSLPVPPGRRNVHKSGNLNQAVAAAAAVPRTHQIPGSPEGAHALDHLHRPLKESRLKLNSSVSIGPDDKPPTSRMKINAGKSMMTTGIEGEFGQ